jgi:hypothetical protein
MNFVLDGPDILSMNKGIELEMMVFLTHAFSKHSLTDGFLGVSPCFDQFKEYSFFSKLSEQIGQV